ncbi:hypothetical protein BDN71DRAFT_736847 [Pleurotus eryngii]|uniref:Uncharacterized protein n=1 Tax=Pleurotus eryngii TaxID=5323 RepID=A0A9P5ZYQ2_PLEER|nr:hypothetical protein BDN71DRAFT_736847 [Pleurotus eryngii]
MGAINTESIHILLHEMGQTYALDDFYDWTPSGVGGFIMQAGSATKITDFDGWVCSSQQDWDDAKVEATLDAATISRRATTFLLHNPQPPRLAIHRSFRHQPTPVPRRLRLLGRDLHATVCVYSVYPSRSKLKKDDRTMRWDRVDRPYDVRAGYLQGFQ